MSLPIFDPSFSLTDLDDAARVLRRILTWFGPFGGLYRMLRGVVRGLADAPRATRPANRRATALRCPVNPGHRARVVEFGGDRVALPMAGRSPYRRRKARTLVCEDCVRAFDF